MFSKFKVVHPLKYVFGIMITSHFSNYCVTVDVVSLKKWEDNVIYTLDLCVSQSHI